MHLNIERVVEDIGARVHFRVVRTEAVIQFKAMSEGELIKLGSL